MRALSTVKGGKPAALWSRPLCLATQEALAGYLAILPWIIGFWVFTVFPLAASSYLSFIKDNLLKLPQWRLLSCFSLYDRANVRSN